MKRIVLEKLILSGTKKNDSILEFKPGLNVITGDSDTGKTYAFQCLNYIFGADTLPKAVPESDGYQQLSLTFSVGGKVYCLTRLFNDSKITVTYDDQSKTFQCKHDATNKNNLSRFMLEIILENSEIIQVKKNQKNEKRTLSFRDLIHLCMVDENKIIAESSAFQSEQYGERTVRSSIFKYVISNKDDSDLIGQTDTANENIKRAGVVQFLEQKKKTLQEKIDGIENNSTYKSFSSSKSLQGALLQINGLRGQIALFNDEISKKETEITSLQKKCFIDEAKCSDFEKLNNHYETELQQKRMINTYADFVEQLPQLCCPICGNSLGESINDSVDSDALFEYFKEQVLSIQKKKKEIVETIEIIEKRIDENKSKIASLKTIVKEDKEKIAELQDQISNYKDSIAMARKMDGLNKELDIYRQEMISVEGDIVAYGEKVKSTKNASNDINPAIFQAYCETIKLTLSNWGINNIKTLDFDPKTLDITIDKNERPTWGKGYRAFYMAAMTISLMRYCYQNGKPHPGFVILDSPLVSLKERKVDSAGEWIQDYMEKRMIEDILNTDELNQVIIFENKDLKYDYDYNYIEFSHNGSGRSGFIES